MKVLLISDYATPTGGAEVMVLGLREALRRRNHEVRLLSSSVRPLGEPSLADDYCFGMASSLRGLTQIWNPSAYLKLRAILKDFQPDIVHVRLFESQISPAILPLLAGTPTLFHAVWYRSICPLGTKLLPDGRDCRTPAGTVCVHKGCIPVLALPSMLLQRHFMERGRGSFNATIANSEATKRRLMAEGLPVDGVIWNGVPVTPARTRLAAVPTAVFAGRLVWEKGTDVLIDAFSRVLRQVTHARLMIAGDGPERQRLESQVARLGLSESVLFLGHVTQEALWQHFAEAWVQVVPSRWHEPFGIAAAEGLMRGTPVIATMSGGLAEFVRDGETGYLCERGQAEPLSEALLKLLRSSSHSIEMGHRARRFALEHLDFEVFTDRFVRVYHALAEGRAVPFAPSAAGQSNDVGQERSWK